MVFLLTLFAAGFALWFFSPRGIAVHAAISEGVELPAPRFPLAGFFRDSSGRNIDWDSHIPARVVGPSCIEYGLEDGNLTIVRILDDAGRKDLKIGDLIVINSPVSNPTTGQVTHPFRFRKINDLIDRDGSVEMKFFPAPGRDVNPQSIEFAHSIVEFLPNSRQLS